MSTRVFLGNVSYNATNDELSNELTRLGHPPKRVEIIKDKETGGSRGFAFAEYEDDAEAGMAIAAIDGQLVHGRPIRADLATPPRNVNRGDHGKGRPRGGSGRNDRGNGAVDWSRGERGGEESWREERRQKGRR